MDKTTLYVTIFSGLLSGLLVFMLQIWLNRRKTKRDDKMEIFKTLMQMRYMNVSHEKTKALNSIEIVFYKCKPVIKAWQELYEAYAVSFNDKDEVQQIILRNNIDDKEIALLEEMANNLGYKKIKWHTIKKSYTPSAISRDILNDSEYRENQRELMRLQKDIAKEQHKEVVENKLIDTERRLKEYQLKKESIAFNEANNVEAENNENSNTEKLERLI